MKFNDSYITNAGYELLLQAAGGNESSNQEDHNSTIVWLDAYTSILDVSGYSDYAMTELTLSDLQSAGYSSSGSVISATSEHVSANTETTPPDPAYDFLRLECALETLEYSGPARVFGVMAKLYSQDDSEAVLAVVARPGKKDDPSSTSVPPAQIPEEVVTLFSGNNYTVDFNIRFINNHSIEVISMPNTFYARRSDLTSLENRVVTLHSLANSTFGDNQTIYGVKSFVDGVTSATIYPTTTNSYNLGSSEYKWNSTYTSNLYTSNLYTSNLAVSGNNSISGTLSVTGNTEVSHDLHIYGNTTLDDSLTVNGNVTIGDLYGDNSYNLLVSSIETDAIEATYIDSLVMAAEEFRLTLGSDQRVAFTYNFSDNAISFCDNAIPNSSSLNFGSQTSKWNSIYTSNLYADNVFGNSSTASSLNPGNYIDGLKFTGSARISHFVVCSTPANDQIKEVLIEGDYLLVAGSRVTIKFNYSNTSLNPMLRVNTSSVTGTAKPIKYSGTSSVSSSSDAFRWMSGDTVEFVYDGTNWVWVNFRSRVDAANTSDRWSNARTFVISDYDSTHSGTSSYVSGASDVELKLPSIIKASISGNASTATSATTSTRATGDKNGVDITTYVKRLGYIAESSSQNVIVDKSHTKQIKNLSFNKLNSINGGGTATTVDLGYAIAEKVSAWDEVGSICLVALKTTQNWNSNDTMPYISGSLLSLAFIRTLDGDSATNIRCNGDILSVNLSGTWRILNGVGTIASGDLMVALAVKVA